MKDTDKVTLTVGQLKKLVKESYDDNGINDNIFDQVEILNDLQDAVEIAIVEANSIIKAKERSEYNENLYKRAIQKILDYTKQIEKFDVIAF